jgi:hypothetical protein
VDPYSTNVLLTSAPPRVFAITLLTAVALVAFLVIARPAVTRIAPRRPPRADDEIVRQALSELE